MIDSLMSLPLCLEVDSYCLFQSKWMEQPCCNSYSWFKRVCLISIRSSLNWLRKSAILIFIRNVTIRIRIRKLLGLSRKVCTVIKLKLILWNNWNWRRLRKLMRSWNWKKKGKMIWLVLSKWRLNRKWIN